MIKKDEISDYITFPRTFKKYKWYKPILVMILTAVLTLVFQGILVLIFNAAVGHDFIMSIQKGGYGVLNTEMGLIFTDLGVIVMILALFIATKIVKDRPFSSYSSSRGGWNFKLYFKALIIPLILYAIFQIITLGGPKGDNHFSIPFFIVCLVLVPLQSIAEEYIYRGLIMQSFGSWFKIPVLAIIIQAVIFAVSHSYNILGTMEILVFGIIAGIFTWKTDGLEVSSAFHTANNLILFVLVMFGLRQSTSSPPLNDVILSIVFEIALFLVMYYVGRKTNWFGEIEED